MTDGLSSGVASAGIVAPWPPRPVPASPTRRPGARVGAVDEYTALQRAALDRVVHHGLDAAAAALRLRTEADRLVVDAPLDPPEAAAVVARPTSTPPRPPSPS